MLLALTMVRIARTRFAGGLGCLLSLSMLIGCGETTPPIAEAESSSTGDGDGDPATSAPSTSDSTPGDGDGDAPGDGDGDTPGDGDGDEPPGDGDGDTPGDGDGDEPPGDGDGDTPGDGDGDEPPGDGDGDEPPGDGDGDEPPGDGDGDFGTEEGGFIMFVPDDDFGMPDLCDPFLQDCLDGEKCVPYASQGGAWDANKCVPILGDQQDGDVCNYGGVIEATDDCGADLMCWNIDDNQQGTCTPFCDGNLNNPICEPGLSCIISNNNSITLCLPDCDPLLQACEPGLGCYWSGSGFQCVFETQNLEVGEACGFLNDCAPGNYCTGADTLPDCNGAACCTSYCDLDNGNGDCAGQQGTECVSFYEMNQAPPGEEDIGLCILAP